MGNLIGVDIGGTKCAIIVGRYLNNSENSTDKVSSPIEPLTDGDRKKIDIIIEKYIQVLVDAIDLYDAKKITGEIKYDIWKH